MARRKYGTFNDSIRNTVCKILIHFRKEICKFFSLINYLCNCPSDTIAPLKSGMSWLLKRRFVKINPLARTAITCWSVNNSVPLFSTWSRGFVKIFFIDDPRRIRDWIKNQIRWADWRWGPFQCNSRFRWFLRRYLDRSSPSALFLVSVVDVDEEFVCAKLLSATTPILTISLIISRLFVSLGRFTGKLLLLAPRIGWTFERKVSLYVIQRLSSLTKPYILLDRRLYVSVGVLYPSPIFVMDGQQRLSRFNRMAFVVLTFSRLLRFCPNWLVRLVLVHRRQHPCRRPHFVRCISVEKKTGKRERNWEFTEIYKCTVSLLFDTYYCKIDSAYSARTVVLLGWCTTMDVDF